MIKEINVDTPVIDEELKRIAIIQSILDPLSPRAVNRILRYLLSQYEEAAP